MRQRWCANCGHVLAGVNAAQCPQCREIIREDEIILFSWPRHLMVRPKVTHKGWFIAGIILFGLPTCIGMVEREWAIATCYGVMTIVLLLGCPWLRCVRKISWRFNPKPRRHARLTPYGYGSRHGFGPVELWQWGSSMETDVTSIGHRLYRLRLIRVTEIGLNNWSSHMEIVFRGSPAKAARVRAYIAQRILEAKMCQQTAIKL